MHPICLLSLGDHDRNGYILGARRPDTAPEYSPNLDIGYNRTSKSWRDASPHLHTASDEFFIVLQGCIHVLLPEGIAAVKPGHLLGVRAGVPHQVVGVEPPVENFLVRAPGGGADKVVLAQMPASSSLAGGVILQDLQQHFSDYPIGACLPTDHPNYSPYLDFSCQWGVDPLQAWQNEDYHYHSAREEYYIQLKGRLEFELDGSILSLHERQILGVRPQVAHRVVGGCGPVHLLFVRVPGGRGDKHLLGPR